MTTRFSVRQSDIPSIARDELYRLWGSQAASNNAETCAKGFIDPALALRQRGYEIRTEANLGEFWRDGVRSTVAGSIDRQAGIVVVSSRLSVKELRFTLAHELAHDELHPDCMELHRERKLDGPTLRKERTEREADVYASHLLMPEKMVREEFAKRFGQGSFKLNEDTAFALCGCSLDRLLLRLRSRRDLARLLADAASYNWRPFISLTADFRVSTNAMAIQLEDFDLVDALPRF